MLCSPVHIIKSCVWIQYPEILSEKVPIRWHKLPVMVVSKRMLYDRVSLINYENTEMAGLCGVQDPQKRREAKAQKAWFLTR